MKTRIYSAFQEINTHDKNKFREVIDSYWIGKHDNDIRIDFGSFGGRGQYGFQLTLWELSAFWDDNKKSLTFAKDASRFTVSVNEIDWFAQWDVDDLLIVMKNGQRIGISIGV